MDEEPIICTVCKKPVVEGEARNGLSGNHWDCDWPNGRKDPWEELRKAGAKIEENSKKINDLLKRGL